MTLTGTTEAELENRVRAAFQRTTALLRRTDPALPVPGSAWTVGEVGAHLLSVQRRYTDRDFTEPAGLSDSAVTVGAANRREVATLGRHAHDEVIDLLTEEFAKFLAVEISLDRTYPFHAHQRIDGAGARANWMGELLIHGYDVARAARVPWPLAERDLQLVLNGVLQVAPGWVDADRARGVDLTVVLQVRASTPQTVRFLDGRCSIDDTIAADRADAVIRGRAVPMTLLLYKRITLAAAIRRGVLVTGGRRPWTGVRLPTLFLAA